MRRAEAYHTEGAIAAPRELTVRAFILGAILALILGAANAYLGLYAGMTVSASIPAAVISMGLLRILGRSTIFENNVVQTIASAGEAVAAGAIFTFPALVILGHSGPLPYWDITTLCLVGGLYPFSLRDDVVQIADLIAAMLADRDRGMLRADIARAFHNTMVEIAVQIALDARAQSGIDVVALSGGCFQNRLLQAGVIERLEAEGLSVLVHHRVPTNDGGLALGQAVVAAACLDSE